MSSSADQPISALRSGFDALAAHVQRPDAPAADRTIGSIGVDHRAGAQPSGQRRRDRSGRSRSSAGHRRRSPGRLQPQRLGPLGCDVTGRSGERFPDRQRVVRRCLRSDRRRHSKQHSRRHGLSPRTGRPGDARHLPPERVHAAFLGRAGGCGRARHAGAGGSRVAAPGTAVSDGLVGQAGTGAQRQTGERRCADHRTGYRIRARHHRQGGAGRDAGRTRMRPWCCRRRAGSGW